MGKECHRLGPHGKCFHEEKISGDQLIGPGPLFQLIRAQFQAARPGYEFG
jgi:hypothetical protein